MSNPKGRERVQSPLDRGAQNHSLILGHLKVNSFIERFSGTILDEFFRQVSRTQSYESGAQGEDLGNFDLLKYKTTAGIQQLR